MFGWRDHEDGGHLDGRGGCELGEGAVVNLRLALVPPQGEVLHRSDVLNLTEQLVLLPLHHGAGVVHRPDGDAIWGL